MTHHYPTAADADIVDRLASLRAILPLIATDLAAARRRANMLELENQRLSGRIAELESKLARTGRHARRRPPDVPDRSLTEIDAFGAERARQSSAVPQSASEDRDARSHRASG